MILSTGSAQPAVASTPQRAMQLAQSVLMRGEAFVNEFLDLPTLENLPRPGDVRAWGHAEWKARMEPLGWNEGEQTKHQFLFEHRTYSVLRFGIAKTPGDVRSMMNSCSDFRKNVVAWRGALHLAFKIVAEGGLIPEKVAHIWGRIPSDTIGEEVFILALRANLPNIYNCVQSSDRSRLEFTGSIQEVRRAIDAVIQAGIVPNRQQGATTFTAWAGEALAESDLLRSTIRDSFVDAPADLPVPDKFVSLAREWSKEVRDAAKLEKELLREERSRQKAERAEAKRQESAEDTRPKTPAELHALAVETAKATAQEALAEAREALATASSALAAFPGAPSDYADLQALTVKQADELAALRAANRDLHESLTTKRQAVAHYEVWLLSMSERYLPALGSPDDAMIAINEALAGSQRTKDLETFLLEAVDAIFESDWAQMGTKVMALRTRAEALIPAGNNHASSKGKSNGQA